MPLRIAHENGHHGISTHNLQATIVLGKREGYEGPVQSTDEILQGLGRSQAEEKSHHEKPLLFIVTESTIAYLDDHGKPVREPCLLLTCDRSPLYAEEGTEEWKQRVEWYAEKLAQAFEQVRVHVTYSEVETRVLESM